MKNATKISTGLTQKLLTFCQGKTTPLVKINPINTIRELVHLLEFTLRSKGELILELTESNRMIEVSEGKLEQIVLNLITNARDAIHEDGTIQLSVQHAVVLDNDIQLSDTEEATHIWIQVKDNGIGMSEQVQKMAMEPFFSSKPSPHHGGLGLSIVRGIVTQYNGIMKLSSELDVGTSISIALPLYKEQQLPDLAARQSHGQLVLLIDDEPDVRYAVRMQLEMLGFSVTEAENINSALTCLSEQEYRLLITDIRLGQESGFDLVMTIRKEGHRLPVLYMTGFSDFKNEHYDPDKNILLKPFNGQELQQMLNKILLT